ncbi:MAG: DinB family protein [Ignavibacteriae bacterium]|nr:DinB family protein [Ignavibacteria bacterium]MBI3363525.1 DinB family protein [Ignavibacteriota bacterium]
MRKLQHMLLFFILCSFQSALAQDTTSTIATAGASFKTAFFSQLNDVEKKIVDLADAMPAEKYTWRPMEGVRSVSEVYMHIAGANYLLPTFMGVKAPEGIDRDAEKKITEKGQVIEFLKKSFVHVRKVVDDTQEADLTKPAKFFGQETTVLGIIMNIAVHMHEHLGQSIAYARMNQIVPPWTAAEQAKQAKEKESKKN